VLPPLTPSSAVSAVICGVSGSGKSTLAAALAGELGWPMVEGDDLHSAANIAKMRAGQELTDADRQPWLATIAAGIGDYEAAGTSVIVTCSALKRRYRDELRAGHPSVRFVCLVVSAATLADRLAHRVGHFMPANLLPSQLAEFEPLEADEPGVTIDAGTEDPADVLRLARAALVDR